MMTGGTPYDSGNLHIGIVGLEEIIEKMGESFVEQILDFGRFIQFI